MNKKTFLPLLLAAGISACDSEKTVEVLSVGANDADSDSVQSNANVSDGTDSDDGSSSDTSDTSDTSADSAPVSVLTQPDRVISQVGLVEISALNTDTDFTQGIFTDLDTALTGQRILEHFVPPGDTCEVKRYNAAFPPVSVFNVHGQEPTQVSAGESVTLTSSLGIYATLERQVIAPFGLLYRSNSALSDDIPADLVLNVPGEVFGGFTDIPVSTAPALVVTLPAADQQVTSDTLFSWNANSDPMSVLQLSAGYTFPETNQVIEIECSVIDDGQFSFDAAMRDSIGEGFVAEWFTVNRVVYDVAESDSAILFIAKSAD